MTSLNKGQRPHEVTEILNYDLDGEQAKILANAELKLLKKEYLECKKEKEQIESVLSICVKEKEQIESDLSHYKEGNLPKKHCRFVLFLSNKTSRLFTSLSVCQVFSDCRDILVGFNLKRLLC